MPVVTTIARGSNTGTLRTYAKTSPLNQNTQHRARLVCMHSREQLGMDQFDKH